MNILISIILILTLKTTTPQTTDKQSITNVTVEMGRGYYCQKNRGICTIETTESAKENNAHLVYDTESLQPIELIIPYERNDLHLKKHFKSERIYIDHKFNLYIRTESRPITIDNGSFRYQKTDDDYIIYFK